MDTRNGQIHAAEEVARMTESERGFMRPMAVDPTEVQLKSGKIGANAPCPCGSRKKFKRCCRLKLPLWAR